MKKRLLVTLLVAVMALSAVLMIACTNYEEATGVSYFVAHQGGYVGEAIVTIDKDGNVTKAELNEYLGPGDWAGTVDGTVVRFAYAGNNPSGGTGVKDFIFFQYVAADSNWREVVPGGSPASNKARDFEGRMGNPRLAAAYVAAIKDNSLCVVTISGTTVTAGEKASVLVAGKSYKVMNKADSTSGYMPISANSIGYRENLKRNIEFFIANPTADYDSATLKELAADFSEAPYTQEKDNFFHIGDLNSGTTWTDFIHYSRELQNAYYFAIAAQRG